MKILIISGAGLLAGSHLYGQLIQKLSQTQRFEKDSDFPEIILHNYPFQSIDKKGYLNQALAKKEIEHIFSSHPDVDYTLLACNTLHVLDFQRKNMIHLPNETMRHFKNLPIQSKALVLCSEYSRQKGLFDNEKSIYPNAQLAQLQDEMIEKNIVCHTPLNKKDIALLKRTIKEESITHLIIGCTELSMLDWKKVGIPVIDSAQIAIEKLIHKICH